MLGANQVILNNNQTKHSNLYNVSKNIALDRVQQVELVSYIKDNVILDLNLI